MKAQEIPQIKIIQKTQLGQFKYSIKLKEDLPKLPVPLVKEIKKHLS